MNTAPRAWIFWLLATAVFLVLLVLLKGILLPFLAGLAVAYFLDPLLDGLQRRGVSRLRGTALLTFLFLLFVALLLALLAPLVISQAADLIKALPQLFAVGKTKLMELLASLSETLGTDLTKRAQEMLASSSSSAVTSLTGLLNEVVQRGMALANLLGLLLITPFVSFFLMLEWDKLVAKVDGWLPRRHLESLRGLFREMDQVLAGFLRGQALVCLVMAVYYAAALSAAGLKFGLLVGLLAGALTFVPFLGALLGLLLTIALALVQLHDAVSIAIPIGLYMLGQVVETNLITPRLVGRRIGLHDVWVIFAVLAGGSLFGLVGALIAVPVAGIVGVLVRFGMARYLASPLYGGDKPAP